MARTMETILRIAFAVAVSACGRTAAAATEARPEIAPNAALRPSFVTSDGTHAAGTAFVAMRDGSPFRSAADPYRPGLCDRERRSRRLRVSSPDKFDSEDGMERDGGDRIRDAKQPAQREQRLRMAKLLAENPNYFGTNPQVELPVMQAIKLDTTYES